MTALVVGRVLMMSSFGGVLPMRAGFGLGLCSGRGNQRDSRQNKADFGDQAAARDTHGKTPVSVVGGSEHPGPDSGRN